MINQHTFRTLPLANQASLIWAEGTYRATRLEDGHKINLYQLTQFYAEIWYHGSMDFIFKVRSFTSHKCLEAYQDTIMANLNN